MSTWCVNTGMGHMWKSEDNCIVDAFQPSLCELQGLTSNQANTNAELSMSAPLYCLRVLCLTLLWCLFIPPMMSIYLLTVSESLWQLLFGWFNISFLYLWFPMYNGLGLLGLYATIRHWKKNGWNKNIKKGLDNWELQWQASSIRRCLYIFSFTQKVGRTGVAEVLGKSRRWHPKVFQFRRIFHLSFPILA